MWMRVAYWTGMTLSEWDSLPLYRRVVVWQELGRFMDDREKASADPDRRELR